MLSFGGPAAQIALMHKLFVEEKYWIDEKNYLSALSFCMLLPGPEAMQLATYIGWRLHGVKGGLIAGLLFITPGALLIAGLAFLYALYGKTSLLASSFLGIKACVLIIVMEALLRISKKALRQKYHWLIAALSFVGIFLFELPFPLIIGAAGLVGMLHSQTNHQPESTNPDKPVLWSKRVTPSQTLGTIFLWLAIWFLPLLLIVQLTGLKFLGELGLFFAKLATVTFGGAYAVLAYMSQEVVFNLNWLTTAEMMDGLGLAETTPGPLILVTEFVGFLAGYRIGGIGLAFLSAVVVLWVTFAPCFLWILVGAPYLEWITAQPRLKNGLAAISAAVVGVIFSLSLWYGLHVLFADVTRTSFGVMQLWQPNLKSLNGFVVGIAVLSGYLLLIRHRNLIVVLAISALLGAIYSLSPFPYN